MSGKCLLFEILSSGKSMVGKGNRCVMNMLLHSSAETIHAHDVLVFEFFVFDALNTDANYMCLSITTSSLMDGPI